MTTSYWLPTIPYTLVDAINRAAAATGSVRYAELAANANYNGHSVTVSFNTYRKYWVTEYFWGGRVVLARGSFEDCARAAHREYQRGALGTRVIVSLKCPAENTVWMQPHLDLLTSLGFAPWSEEIDKAWYNSWADDRFAEVGHALKDRTEHLLLKAANLQEYQVACDTAHFGEVEKVCHLKKGDEVMDIYVRANRVHFYIGSQVRATAPRVEAREMYRRYLNEGWTAF
jgi:hypothetical protein